jgi:hypothetical protein
VVKLIDFEKRMKSEIVTKFIPERFKELILTCCAIEIFEIISLKPRRPACRLTGAIVFVSPLQGRAQSN